MNRVITNENTYFLAWTLKASRCSSLAKSMLTRATPLGSRNVVGAKFKIPLILHSTNRVAISLACSAGTARIASSAGSAANTLSIVVTSKILIPPIEVPILAGSLSNAARSRNPSRSNPL